MSNIYTYRPSGNKLRCNEVLGVARNVLRMAVEEMNQRGIDSLIRRHTLDNGQTDITVLCTASGNSRISINSSYIADEEPEERTYHRERMLHCKVTLTLCDDIPPYTKDPSFIAVEPIPVTDTTVELHVFFEVDKRQGLFIDNVTSEMAMDEAKDVIEKVTKYKLLGKKKDSDGNVTRFFDQTGGMVVPPETPEDYDTQFNALLDSSLFDWQSEIKVLDGYQYELTNGLSSGYRSMALSDYGVFEPFDTFDAELFSDEYIKKYEKKIEEETASSWKDYYEFMLELYKKYSIVKYHATRRMTLYRNSKNFPEEFNLLDPYGNELIEREEFDFKGNINGEDILHRYGCTLNIGVPLMRLTTDFTARHGDLVYIGDISTAATRSAKTWLAFDKVDNDTGEAVVTYLLPDVKLFNTILPYYVEVKDPILIAQDFSSLTGSSAIYGNDPIRNIVELPNTVYDDPESYDNIYDALEDFYYISYSSNRLVLPYRNKFWHDNLSDHVPRQIAEEEAKDKCHVPSPRITSSDIPNRIILCVRSFFANTDKATQLKGKRREYGIIARSSLRGGKFIYDYKRIESDYSFTEIETETSRPLSIRECPNFTTEKNDVVSVILMSSIYAVSDYGAITEDKLRVSPFYDTPEHPESALSVFSNTSSSDMPDREFSKLPWPATFDGNWVYTNIYSASVGVRSLGGVNGVRNRYIYYAEKAETSGDCSYKNRINDSSPYMYMERMSRGESIYSDSEEDVSTRYIEDESKMSDITWKEEDTPESHIIHCIYRALDNAGYDKHHPICDIKLEANLYDKEVYDDTGEKVQ